MANGTIEKFIKIAVDRHIQNSIVKFNEINFKCNICGDSRHNPHTKRARLYLGSRTNTWLYYCYNGGCPANSAWKAQYWLERTDYSLYKEYVMEVSTGGKYSYSYQYKSSQETLNKIKKKVYKDYSKDFYHILKDLNDELSLKAIAYCKSRYIPEEIYNRFYLCKTGKFSNRLIIPFYKDNTAYYYQGRSLIGEEPKYLNKLAEKSLCLYNIFEVDKTKPVILCEGVFDSIFIENSVAILGVKINDLSKELIKDLNKYYLFDDDEAGKKTSEVFLKNGEYIFLWKKFKLDYQLPIEGRKMDINDSYIYLNRTEKFTFKELEKYFSNNIFDRIYL